MTDIGPDEDGGARRDWKSGEENQPMTLQLRDPGGGQVDPSNLHLEELVLPPDVKVSVYGQWSAARQAIAAGVGRGRPGKTRNGAAEGARPWRRPSALPLRAVDGDADHDPARARAGMVRPRGVAGHEVAGDTGAR